MSNSMYAKLLFFVGMALLAYFLWNIDVNFCSTLTSWKHQVGMPWGIILELHSWWHILTAIASYTFMALNELVTSETIHASSGLGFAWPAKAVLEQIGRGTAAGWSGHVNRNGHVNGNVQKKSM